MPEPTQSYGEVLKEVEVWNKAQEHLLMNKDAISRKQLNEQIETLEQRKKDGTRDLENARKLQTVSLHFPLDVRNGFQLDAGKCLQRGRFPSDALIHLY